MRKFWTVNWKETLRGDTFFVHSEEELDYNINILEARGATAQYEEKYIDLLTPEELERVKRALYNSINLIYYLIKEGDLILPGRWLELLTLYEEVGKYIYDMEDERARG